MLSIREYFEKREIVKVARTARTSRQQLITELALEMRLFMAHAVLFQDAVAKRVRLNPVDLQVAGLLLLEGPLSPSDLARRTGLTGGGAITSVIDRLERADLVERVRDRVDRRRVLVTPDVDALTRRIAPAYERVNARWVAYLGTLEEAQIASLRDALRAATAIDREEIESLRTADPSEAASPAL
jgi:DNA-binding MarR family transcriptional regulator